MMTTYAPEQARNEVRIPASVMHTIEANAARLIERGYRIEREIVDGSYIVTGGARPYEVSSYRQSCKHLLGLPALLEERDRLPRFGEICLALMPDGEWIRATFFWVRESGGFSVAADEGWNKGEWLYAVDVTISGRRA